MLNEDISKESQLLLALDTDPYSDAKFLKGRISTVVYSICIFQGLSIVLGSQKFLQQHQVLISHWEELKFLKDQLSNLFLVPIIFLAFTSASGQAR